MYAIAEAPVIILPLNFTRVFITGDDIVLHCSAAGVPRPSFIWYKDGSLLMNESLSLIISEESEVNGVLHTVSNLLLISADVYDIGIYICLATNFVGNVSAEWEVQVNTGISVQMLESILSIQICLREIRPLDHFLANSNDIYIMVKCHVHWRKKLPNLYQNQQAMCNSVLCIC